MNEVSLSMNAGKISVGKLHHWTIDLTFCPNHTIRPPSEPVICLMWDLAHGLTARCNRLRAPQHDLAPITHTPGFTKSADMEEPWLPDSQSTGRPFQAQYTLG
ncbi:unnamed protein product [Schistocephalus solidus]|uniref:DDE_Tnp_1 domain-containing protein n=1 Tax=Schistocephalus solidus TaxID=70667 RepID=A0A183SHP4_SCHSO|nr:unnamed protein product [Schistocephalus solidus]